VWAHTISVFALHLSLASPLAIGAEWLAGDLHLHSIHSDGQNTVHEIIVDAEARGLDFIALTDHDAPDGDMSHWYDEDYVSQQLVLLYGAEWTCIMGHANMLSTEPWDYADMWQANLSVDPESAYASAVAQDVSMGIVHPRRPGFSWMLPWRGTPLIEIWNGKTTYPVHADVAFWEQDLLAGRKVVGIGGSDMHCLDGGSGEDCPVDSVIGEPTTWVYADRTPKSVLNAIDEGLVSISASRSAPRLVISEDFGLVKVHIENVALGSPTLYLLDVYRNDKIAFRVRITVEDLIQFQIEPGVLFYRAELYSLADQAGESKLLALTNPVYVEKPSDGR
jgi:hypothetical protein